MRFLGAIAAASATAAVVAALAAGQPGTTGDSWPIYGKDLSNSRDAGLGGPSPAAARTLHRVWRFTTPTAGLTGTPVVADGLVVAASIDGTVYALDAATGEQRWRWHYDGQDYLPGSPGIDGDRVYVTMQAPSVLLFALGLHDGALRWKTDLDPSGRYSVDASPVIWNGRVYLGLTGVKVERGETHARLRGHLVAVDSATGAIRWRSFAVPRGSDGGSIWSSPAIDPATHRLYEGTGNHFSGKAAPTTEAIVQFDADGGRLLRWYKPRLTRRQLKLDLDFGASVNLFRGPGGRLLAGELQKSGIYWALDARTMRKVWSRTTVPGGSVDSIGSTASDGTRIYGQDASGREWALSSGGRLLWVTGPGGGNTNFGPVAVANGVVYAIKSSGALEARDASKGNLLARLPLGATSWGGVSIAGGCAFTVAGRRPEQPGFVEKFCP
jgi:polyvinyl alcohol dehydrogenase (cytochrome)